ncbi:MAG TPA: OmpA family protein, partial [Mycobacterium sp.]|nr:OmpA family protein [Mycobacterium sp.]
DDLRQARGAVLGTVRAATARSDHADLLTALGIAADQGRQSGDSVRILVVDNGLSDTGPVDIAAPGMSTADPSDVGAFVASRGSCPASLAGTSMTMYGAGYGVAPQEVLSTQQMGSVGRIWQEVIAACGGHLDLVPTPRTDPGPDTPFRVEPVAPLPAPTMTAMPAGQTLEFTGESALTFAADSAELRDPGAARTALAELADYLRGGPSRTVTISGTTSNGPTAWPAYVDLARARSETVKALLVAEFGVLPQQIRCEGLGYVADPPVVDPATAALNRRTRIHVDS